MAANDQDFHRINDPRIEKIMHTIKLVEKSAASMRVPEAGGKALQRVANYLTPHQQLPTVPRAGASAAAPVEVTDPIARELGPVADLSTQQLVDRMIAYGVELGRRRQ